MDGIYIGFISFILEYFDNFLPTPLSPNLNCPEYHKEIHFTHDLFLRANLRL